MNGTSSKNNMALVSSNDPYDMASRSKTFNVSYLQHHITNTASEAMKSNLHNETFSEKKTKVT